MIRTPVYEMPVPRCPKCGAFGRGIVGTTSSRMRGRTRVKYQFCSACYSRWILRLKPARHMAEFAIPPDGISAGYDRSEDENLEGA